ncbi:hypothetical protein OAE22_01495 [bacterium]|nr:hypothetical protein [bacterium]
MIQFLAGKLPGVSPNKRTLGEALKLFRARKSQLKEYRASLQEALDLHFYDSQGKEDDDRSKST